MKIKILLLSVITIYFLVSPLHETVRSWAGQNDINFLPEILSMPDIDVDSGIFFADQNTGKAGLIQRILIRYGYSEKTVIDADTGKSITVFNLQRTLDKPVIEFMKINPTKYRMRIHRAKSGFPLIFSESFHKDWKAYIVRSQGTPRLNPVQGAPGGAIQQGKEDGRQRSESRGRRSEVSCEEMLRKYKVLEGNEEDQASLEELKVFLEKGFVTALGDGQPKERKHLRYLESGAEKLDHVETYTIDFISKDFNGTIQNNNLPTGHFWESWLPGNLVLNCPRTKGEVTEPACETNPNSWRIDESINNNLIEWPDIFHWQVNGYANSWWIDPAILRILPGASKEEQGFYTINPDGTVDFEVVLDFWPQRLFYVGIFISSTTLVFCLIYLIYGFLNTRFKGHSKGVLE